MDMDMGIILVYLLLGKGERKKKRGGFIRRLRLPPHRFLRLSFAQFLSSGFVSELIP